METNQKERTTRVLHKPKKESALRPTFAASQVPSTSLIRATTYGTSNSFADRIGENERATGSRAGSLSHLSQDFTRIPTRTTQVSGGLMPGVTTGPEQDKVVGGFVGTLANISNKAGAAHVNRAPEPPAAPTAVEISTTDTSAPVWSPHGAFSWHIGFNTTGKDGWIVQRVTNTYSGTDSKGKDINNTNVGATPSYYEAWKVDSSGKVSPSIGATNDIWSRPSLAARPPISDPKTKGRWSMVGDVYFTKTDPAASGLTKGGVPDAGILLSGTSEPADLGSVRLPRVAKGEWDSTVSPATHNGSNM